MNPSIAGRPARLLIVDDERDNREVLKIFLTYEGFVVLTAASGEEALATVAREPPDLILLDVRMPGMSGDEVLAKLKGDLTTKNIPVIMVSADGDAKTRTLSAGADGFITKPLSRIDVFLRVKSLLGR